jgi:hypothetical protein
MADRKFYSPTPSCPLIELGPTIILHNGTEAATSYLSQKPPRHPINKHVDNVVKVATPQVPPPRSFLLFVGTFKNLHRQPTARISTGSAFRPVKSETSDVHVGGVMTRRDRGLLRQRRVRRACVCPIGGRGERPENRNTQTLT